MSHALQTRGATLVLDGRRILDDVSFEVERGEFACLCGPNGGGKTTLIKAALGLVTLTAGEISVLGETPEAARPRVGYLPQAKTFNPNFPARVVDVVAANRRGEWPVRMSGSERERARATLARVGGAHLLDSPLRGLSGGELQRVYLARALVTEPLLLLLDEPTAGVDARGRAEFLGLLAEVAAREDLAAVLVTHSATTARKLARRVLYLDGRVRAWGPPAQVLDREWGKAAFSGHDHADEVGPFCEGDS
jgi:zinc transport system ATP-binding protein